MVLCGQIGLVAQTQNQTKQLKEVTSTEGRDFYVAWMPNGGSEPGSSDLKLQLLASSRVANQITVEYANGATQNFNIAAGGTTIINVDPNSVYWDPAKDEEEKPLSKGIRVYSNVDEVFSLYSVNQMGAPGSFKLRRRTYLAGRGPGNGVYGADGRRRRYGYGVCADVHQAR